MVEAQSSAQFAAPEIDLDRPNMARIQDCLLGGSANWAIDREFVRRALQRFPLLKQVAAANRNFVNRVVRYFAKRGIRQFLDVGAGIPATWSSTHRIVAEVAPESRVVYVDNEPVAVAHAEIVLDQEGDPARHAIVQADLRSPEDLWRQALDTGLIDPKLPVVALMIGVLDVYQPGPDGSSDIGAESVARFREVIPEGSYLAVSHVTDDGIPEEFVPKVRELNHLYDRMCSSNVIWRSRAEIDALLGDFHPVGPGMVWTPQWHPEEARWGPDAFTRPNEAMVWAGVGRKGTSGVR